MNFSFQHRFPYLIDFFTLEWCKPMQQLVEQDSKSPDIDFMIILTIEDHLRGHILIGPAESLMNIVDALHHPTQITYFYVVVLIQQ